MNSNKSNNRQLIMGSQQVASRNTVGTTAPKWVAVLLLLCFWATNAFAQADSVVQQRQTVDMATAMRSNGKIYVVVAVLVIILTGIFLYLIRLDRKIARLEKND
jgi:CcmD family protein